MKNVDSTVAGKYLSGYNLLEDTSGDFRSDVQLVSCCCRLKKRDGLYGLMRCNLDDSARL
jgi:hypothetical protein